MTPRRTWTTRLVPLVAGLALIAVGLLIVVPQTVTTEASVPSGCPRQPYPVLASDTPSSRLDVVSAVVCVYAAAGPPTRKVLPGTLVLAMDRDYRERVVDRPNTELCIGLEPTLVVYGQTLLGDRAVLTRYCGPFSRGSYS